MYTTYLSQKMFCRNTDPDKMRCKRLKFPHGYEQEPIKKWNRLTISLVIQRAGSGNIKSHSEPDPETSMY